MTPPCSRAAIACRTVLRATFSDSASRFSDGRATPGWRRPSAHLGQEVGLEGARTSDGRPLPPSTLRSGNAMDITVNPTATGERIPHGKAVRYRYEPHGTSSTRFP